MRKQQITVSELARVTGITESELDKPCTDDDLLEISLLIVQWRTLGPHLGLEQFDIVALEHNLSEEGERPLGSLQRWRDKKSYHATYAVLVNALLRLGWTEIARKVVSLLAPDSDVDVAVHPLSTQKDAGSVVTAGPIVRSPRPIRTRIKLLQEIDGLEEKFDSVIGMLQDDLETVGVSLRHFKRQLTRLPVSLKHQHIKFLEESFDDIENAATFNKVFFVLGKYWDFLNCGLLCHTVSKFGSTETQVMLQQYQDRLQSFRKQVKLGEFVDMWIGEVPPLFSEFIAVAGDDWKEQSLEDLEQFKIELSRRCAFEAYADIQLKRIGSGSIVIRWAMQQFFLQNSEVFEVTVSILQKYGFTEVTKLPASNSGALGVPLSSRMYLERPVGERMAQIGFTRRSRSSPLSTGELYDHTLPEEEADETADVEGSGTEAREHQPRTVGTLLEYVNRRAQEDETARRAQEDKTTCGAEEHSLRLALLPVTDDRAVQIGMRLIMVGDELESANQQTIETIIASIFEDRPEQGSGSAQAHTYSGQPPRLEVVYRHLSDVFWHMFTWEEIRNGTYDCLMDMQRCEVSKYTILQYCMMIMSVASAMQ